MRDALIDTRPIESRLRDYSRDEILIAGSGVPFTNKQVTILTQPVTDQYQTGSCVVHAMMTQLSYEGIISSEDYSRLATYRKRFNYPGGGSNGVDMYSKFRAGQTPWNLSPTPVGATEAFANSLKLLNGAKLLSTDFEYFSFSDAYTPNKALHEYIPHDVNAGKAVQVFIYATNAEWRREWVEPTDKRVTLSNAVVRHSVVLIPKGDFTKDGKRWYSVHDSAAFGGRFLRYISEEFLEKRCYWGAIVVPKGETKPTPAPSLGLPLDSAKFGDRSLAVQKLQAFLISKNYLGQQYLTGYYGALTMGAVLHFQLYHHLEMKDSIPELLKLKGEFWGPQSIAVVKSLKD